MDGIQEVQMDFLDWMDGMGVLHLMPVVGVEWASRVTQGASAVPGLEGYLWVGTGGGGKFHAILSSTLYS